MEAANNFGDNIKNQISGLGDGMKDRLAGVGLSTEDPFYMYVGLGALVILILVLIGLGIMMSEIQSATLFPPTQNACPDYWDLAPNGQCVFPHASASDRNNGAPVMSNTNNPNTSIYGIKVDSPGFNTWGPELSVNDGAGNFYTGASSTQNPYIYVSLSDASGQAGLKKLYPGLTTICAQKRWALNNGIVWDGVTNYNGC